MKAFTLCIVHRKERISLYPEYPDSMNTVFSVLKAQGARIFFSLIYMYLRSKLIELQNYIN